MVANSAAWRVVMPLFQFQYRGEAEFAFTDTRFCLCRFGLARELPDCDLFSGQDKRLMAPQRWALVANVDELLVYQGDVSLLLMTFRLLSVGLSPFIKYRLSNDLSACCIINEVATHIKISPRRFAVYQQSDLISVNETYEMLRAAESKSIRLKNALYCLYVGFHADRWLEGFLMLMMALEALFSKDTGGSATKTICRRVANFLSDATVCTEATMTALYDMRSRIVHGTLRAPNRDDNLQALSQMHSISTACLLKFIREDKLKVYATDTGREHFLSQFN